MSSAVLRTHICAKTLFPENIANIFQVLNPNLQLFSHTFFNIIINLDILKSHSSHDVVLLCPECHQRSNISDNKLRSRLANQCNAPIQRVNNERNSEIARIKYAKYFLCRLLCVKKSFVYRTSFFRNLKSNINAVLRHADKIPPKRVEEMRNEVLSNFPPGTELTEDLLQINYEAEIL